MEDKQINNNLTEKEKQTSDKLLQKGFRSTTKKMNLTIKLYNSLCNKCKTKVLQNGLNNPKQRLNLLGNPIFYCEICQEKVNEIIQKLSKC